MAVFLKGKPAADAISDKLRFRIEELKKKGVYPKLAIMRVGERPDDISYERGAKKRCDTVGIEIQEFVLPLTYKKNELLDNINRINSDDSIHGCLLLRPLPDREDEAEVCALLSPHKDVDCITDASLAGVFTGKDIGFAPCTAQACIEILDYYGYELSGKRITVIGRSLVIGKPVSMMLQFKNATVTMCHTKTDNLKEECRRAQIILAAAGHRNIIDESFVMPGQTVIDVGINVTEEGKLCGDVCFDSVEPVVAAITPVPGGIGSVTTAVLAKHVTEAAEKISLSQNAIHS